MPINLDLILEYLLGGVQLISLIYFIVVSQFPLARTNMNNDGLTGAVLLLSFLSFAHPLGIVADNIACFTFDYFGKRIRNNGSERKKHKDNFRRLQHNVLGAELNKALSFQSTKRIIRITMFNLSLSASIALVWKILHTTPINMNKLADLVVVALIPLTIVVLVVYLFIENNYKEFLSSNKDKIKAIIKLRDLRYELQLLLGANRIIKYINSWDRKSKEDNQKFGNIVNYYKSCAYLHTRNLFNALTREEETEIGKIPKITSSLYQQWKPAIEKFGLHLNTSRDQQSVSNKIKGKDLNAIIPELVEDLIRCWSEWIEQSSDVNGVKLIEILDECDKSSEQDLGRFKMVLMGSTSH